jgi:hypothetical protein
MYRARRDEPGQIIHDVRTARAAFLPSRFEHEVVDDEVAMISKKIPQLRAALLTIEGILLLDLDHGKLSALRGRRISLPREFLFLGEQRFAGDKPFISRRDFRKISCSSPSAWISRLILSASVVAPAFARNFFTTSAARPPVVGVPAAIRTTVNTQVGHIRFLLDQPPYSS